MKNISRYVFVSIILLFLDAIWISTNYELYNKSVLAVQKSELKVNYFAAFIAYLFVIFTSLYIAIPFTVKNIEKNDKITAKLYKSFIYGGSVGLAIYSIYNCTSKALYDRYEWNVVIYDTMWGTFLNTIVVFIYLIIS